MATPDDGDEHQYESDTTPREVFQHELGHLALGRFIRGSAPVWVREGGAMDLAGEQRIRSWRAGLADGTFEMGSAGTPLETAPCRRDQQVVVPHLRYG